MNKKILDLMNEQYNLEIESSFNYRDMANWAEDKGLKGVANWFNIQADEEMDHANMFAKYLQDRGQRPQFRNLDVTTANYKNVLEVAEKTLELEQTVTQKINAIMALAKSENDFASEEFLNFFVKEQVEEEANAQDLIDKIKLYGDNVYYVDLELGKRIAE